MTIRRTITYNAVFVKWQNTNRPLENKQTKKNPRKKQNNNITPKKMN